MAFIEDAKLMADLFDYLSMQCTDEANDLMKRMRVEVDSNYPTPEGFGLCPKCYQKKCECVPEIKLWEPKELEPQTNLEDFTNGSKEAN